MSIRDLAPEHVRAIAPYVPGKPIAETARELGLQERDIVKLASNENPLGPSPKAIAALAGAVADLALYPDGSGYDLRRAIARKQSLAPENVVLGNGSNDVLELVARTFLTREDSAVYSQHGFVVYRLAVQALGGEHIEVPARQFGHDLDALLSAIRPNTKVVFLANPNNPTGTFLPWPELERFVARVPGRTLVVIDEAYGEYLPTELASPTASWVGRFPNLVVSRSLSKAYGLAGLRIGYGLADPAVVELLDRVRQPFNVNHLAMVAACAALEDGEFIARSRRENEAGLAQLRQGFDALGLPFIPSVANFITVKVGDAARVYGALLRRGVIVRPIAAYGLPEHLRITVGTHAQNVRFLSALAESLAER